jgi:RasGAP C-terminus
MTFKEVKAHAIQSLLELEKQGRIDRKDGFQGILNAIAGDVRSKHRKRLQRQQEMERMNLALRHLAERKKYFEEQINSYHDYVDGAMHTMQRGKGSAYLIYWPATVLTTFTGRSVSSFRSQSSTFISANYRSRVKPLNLGHSNIPQSIYMIRASYCPLTNTLRVNSTKWTSRSHLMNLGYSL